MVNENFRKSNLETLKSTNLPSTVNKSSKSCNGKISRIVNDNLSTTMPNPGQDLFNRLPSLCIDTIKNSNLNSKTVEKALSTSIINLSNAFNENKLNSNEKMQVLNLMNKQTDCIMEIEKDNKILRNVLIATTFVTLVGTTVYKACNNRK